MITTKFSKSNSIKFGLVLIGLIMVFSYGTGHAAAANNNTIIIPIHPFPSQFNNEYVNNTSGNDSNWGISPSSPKKTINSAIGAVNDNGTVHIASGTYNGSSITINNNMTIIGENQSNTIINLQDNLGSFIIGKGVTVTFEDLTIENGYGGGGDGAAIYNNDGTLIINNCTLTDNGAVNGGAICNNEGTLTVMGSTFTSNQAYGTDTTNGEGGAIYNYKGTLNVTGSTFTGNTALWYAPSGAIYNYDGTATLRFNRLSGNANPEIYNNGGSVDALYNWWGTNTNPTGEVNTGVSDNPWIISIITTNPTMNYGESSIITVDLTHDSNGDDTIGQGNIPDGTPVTFTTNWGTITPTSTTVNGEAIAIFTANGTTLTTPVQITATVDSASVNSIINILKSSTTITVGAVHNFAGQNVTLTAHVNDFHGNPVNEGQVNFTVGTATPVSVNVVNGLASIKWLIPSSWTVGNYSIVANYLGNTNYVSSVNNSTLTVAPPLIVNSIDPAKGAVDVLNNQSVNVTFTEPVKLGNGDIVLETSNGTVVNVSNSISGDVLTITPTNLLTNDTKYNVIIHTGSVTDLEGDPVALWSSSFSVGPAPTITSIDPANEATNVSTSKIITVSFSEPIEVGNSDIQFTNSSGSAIPFTKTISGNVLIIIPTNPLAESTKYTLTLHTGSVTDLTGNPLKLTSTTFTTTKT